MTPKEKYNDIDLSKLPEAAVEQLKKVKPFLFEEKFQKAEYAENLKKAEQGMDKLYDIISDKYPESVKSKVKKQPEPETPVAMAKQAAQETVNQPKKGKSKASAGKTKRGNVINLAKEIRKEGESWTEARRRAGQMIQAQKKKAVTKANKQYEKLKAFLTANPMVEKTEVTYGSKSAGWSKRPISVNRDAPRKALPAGRRIAKKSKNVYYEYRANRTDKQRNRYPYLALGGKLHGAGMFAKGGMVDYSKDGYVKAIRGIDGKLVKEVNVDGEMYRYNPVYRTYNSVIGNELLHKSKYAKGGEISHMNTAKFYWNIFDKKRRIDYLVGAGYSKSVANDLSNEKWESLESGVHKRLLASIMAKGGVVNQSKAKKIFAEFEKNEDENYHSENVILLAKHFGTAAELKEAKAILKEHEEAGSLTSALRKRRDSLYDKLMPKLRTALKAKK